MRNAPLRLSQTRINISISPSPLPTPKNLHKKRKYCASLPTTYNKTTTPTIPPTSAATLANSLTNNPAAFPVNALGTALAAATFPIVLFPVGAQTPPLTVPLAPIDPPAHAAVGAAAADERVVYIVLVNVVMIVLPTDVTVLTPVAVEYALTALAPAGATWIACVMAEAGEVIVEPAESIDVVAGWDIIVVVHSVEV